MSTNDIFQSWMQLKNLREMQKLNAFNEEQKAEREERRERKEATRRERRRSSRRVYRGPATLAPKTNVEEYDPEVEAKKLRKEIQKVKEIKKTQIGFAAILFGIIIALLCYNFGEAVKPLIFLLAAFGAILYYKYQ